MSKRGISEIDVHRVAMEAIRDGVSPSGEEIYRRLGEKGSKTTIFKYLDSLWPKLAAMVDEGPALPDLPKEIQDAMLTLWASAHAHARDEAKRRLSADRAAVANAQAHAEELAATARATQENAERALAKAAERVAGLEDEIQGTESELEEAEIEIKRLHAALAEREAALSSLRKERDGLLASAEETKAAHAATLAALHQQETAHRDVMLVEVDRVREEAKRATAKAEKREASLMASLAKAGSDLLDAARDRGLVEVKLAQCQSELEVSQRQMRERDEALAKITTELHKTAEDNALLRATIEQMRKTDNLELHRKIEALSEGAARKRSPAAKKRAPRKE